MIKITTHCITASLCGQGFSPIIEDDNRRSFAMLINALGPLVNMTFYAFLFCLAVSLMAAA
ncbi:MAG: hypothetical protein WCD18_01190 [Thermosynechococcaceae cyanobacterium]